LYLYITPECIQYRECTQAEPTRQEHLVRANRPTQAEPTQTSSCNYTRPAVAIIFFNKISQSYSVLAITSDPEL
jgi:hypothetical protein